MFNFIAKSIRLAIAASLLAGLFVVAPTPPALAATIAVTTTDDELNNDGDCSLREAIRAANINSAVDACLAGDSLAADTITAPAGLYKLTLVGINEDEGLTGDLDITDDLTINGAGASATIIDGNGSDRVLHIPAVSPSLIGNGATVQMNDLTIRNGMVTSAGGGIYNGGSLSLSNSVVSGNTQNQGGSHGGSISNLGILNLSNVIVSGNTGSIGNIYNGYGTVNITNSTISGNTALDAGGGIYNFGGVVNITNSSIINNTAFVNAGGVLNCVGNPSIPGDCSMTLIESTISGNTADSYNGGGLYNVGEMTVSNSTVSGNSAKGEGGGIINVGGTSVPNMLDLFNVTVTNNTADSNADGTGDGGGIWLYNSTFNAQNSLIANNHDNSPATRHPDCSGTMTSLGYNLVGNDSGCSITVAVGDQRGTSGTPINPLLGPLQNNGGATFTHALLSGSPAINTGNPATPGSGGNVCLATDQRGVNRPQGATCDIGAYEAIAPALNFPASGNTPPTARPLFDWANVATATSYTLQISTNQNFTSLVLNTIITPSAYVPTNDLPRNILLFWRVRANGPGGPSAWSRVRHLFSANPPGVPTLLTPANGATAANGQPMLDWSDATPAATYYEVQISTDANFATVLGRGRGGRVTLSAYTPEAALGSGTFFWRARAVSGGADGGMQFSQWSAARSFHTPP